MARGKRLTAVERRAQLIEVGATVFAEHGYAGTSVEEIARVAKVSKPLIYEHFGGKEGLYAVVIDREMEQLYALIQASISEGSPRKRFQQAVVAFLTYAKEHPAGFAVLTRDAPTSVAGQGMGAVLHSVGERVGEIFEREFAKAGFDPKVAPIYAHALIGMVTATGQWWTTYSDLPIETVSAHLAALGWMGLRHLPKKPTKVD